MSSSSDIPAFWAQRGFDDNNCEKKLYKHLNPPKHGEYYICINTNMATDDFLYLMAVGVDNFDKATDDMCKLKIPTAIYAIFTTPQVLEDDFVDSINGRGPIYFRNGFQIHNMKLMRINSTLNITLSTATHGNTIKFQWKFIFQ